MPEVHAADIFVFCGFYVCSLMLSFVVALETALRFFKDNIGFAAPTIFLLLCIVFTVLFVLLLRKYLREGREWLKKVTFG
ncbi:MAG: hypothetical protein ACPLW8_05200 [Candidatus Bathyarchaeales archaeon]